MVAVIIAMGVFSLVMSISPGPVNMVILSSGATYGFKKTIAFVSGATIGFTFLLAFIGFWFIHLINLYPTFLVILEWLGSAFIIYMGYKILCASTEVTVQTTNQHPTFMQGALLQWLNPKAWIACAAGVTQFSVPESYLPLVLFISIYFVICYLSLAAWAGVGDKITLFLTTRWRMKMFNLIMGSILILTALYLLIQSH